MKITEDCINCAACVAECPNNAVYGAGEKWEYNGKFYAALVDDFFFIVPQKCSECEGLFNSPPCIVICPMNCIIKQT